MSEQLHSPRYLDADIVAGFFIAIVQMAGETDGDRLAIEFERQWALCDQEAFARGFNHAHRLFHLERER